MDESDMTIVHSFDGMMFGNSIKWYGEIVFKYYTIVHVIFFMHMRVIVKTGYSKITKPTSYEITSLNRVTFKTTVSVS